jgi:hypothetical protein
VSSSVPEPPEVPVTVVLSEDARNDPAVLHALVALGDALHLAAATSPAPPPAGRRRARGGPIAVLPAIPGQSRL